MNKARRIQAALDGAPWDRRPFSFWTHMPDVDLDPALLADRTYDFYRTHDLDFIKLMNNGMYPIEDFDCVIDRSAVPRGGVARLVQGPIDAPEDWERIRPLDETQGALGRELRYLERLQQQVRGEAPVVATVFSPLTIAHKLSKGRVREHLQAEDTGPVLRALDAITETTVRFTERLMTAGADGIFFATQLGSRDLFAEEPYRRYGVPWDLKVLGAAQGAWFNILHVHGENIFFPLFRDYPVHCINWHIWESPPDLLEARAQTRKCLMGGLVRGHITERNRSAIQEDMRRTRRQMKGSAYILTPGCGIRHPVDPEILEFIRRMVQGGDPGEETEQGRTSSHHDP